MLFSDKKNEAVMSMIEIIYKIKSNLIQKNNFWGL